MTTPFPFVAGAVLQAAQLNAITTLPINDQTASYTLVVGDVGKRVIMNVASASTVTVNNSIFAAGDSIFIANKASNASVITAGAGVTINTSGSLSLAQYGGGTLVALSASTFTFFPAGGIGYGTATGGTTLGSPPAGYTVLAFTSSGTLTVTKAGLFDVMVVGGGGGGARRSTTTFGSGGGGGGAVQQTTIYLTANATVTVGAKGAAQTSANTAGNRGTYTAIGEVTAGGGGGGDVGGNNLLSAGSGGGGMENGKTSITLISLNANNGGNTTSDGTNAAVGGGGGGSTAVGANANVATNTAGNGGAGTDVSTFIGGSALFHGAGGGGGAGTGTGGTAGSSTGGNGGSSGAQGSNATGTNYGCGGGGGAATQGGAGADGVVYIRFKS